jgi:catechol 2,3-dioxygenase
MVRSTEGEGDRVGTLCHLSYRCRPRPRCVIIAINTNEGSVPMPRSAMTPAGLNHLVLNVRNMDESHRFWTEILGFTQVGQLHATPQRPNPPNMRFYSGDHGGGSLNHHDVALVENTSLPAPPAEWSMFGMPCAINHIAIALPSREAWLEQLAFLQQQGVKFDRRVEHGMTHSLYIHDPNGYGIELLYELPRDVWEGDIEAALNYAAQLPTEGREALADREEGFPVFGAAEQQPA